MISGSESSRITVSEAEGTVTLTILGRLDVQSTGDVWSPALAAAERGPGKRVVADVAGVSYCDMAGIGLLVQLRRRNAEIRGLNPAFQALMDFFPDKVRGPASAQTPKLSFTEEIGKAALCILRDVGRQVSFLGEVLFAAVASPRDFRWRDAARVAEAAGVNALPIITLLGFLIGLILAFESAIPLKQFGAELFVANLVAISVVRELGPLMTSILLAGRSGSAFAAELGTMKVNEEIDALVTMGLAPVRFLALPRIAAGVLVTPLLTIYFDLVALIGGGLVVTSFGFPIVTYYHQVHSAISVTLLFTGFVKTLMFGLIVSAVGCQKGLETGTGAVAVGASTTRSVVASIVLMIVADGIFAVVYYFLGI